MLSPAKQGIFRPLVGKAWGAHCARKNLQASDRGAQDKWYRSILLETAHVYTTNEIRAADQFDAVCLAFATIWGDEREITYWVRAPERRLMWLIRDRLDKISFIAGTRHGWPYAVAINTHMNLPLTMEEAPESDLKKVFNALDKRLQGLRKRAAANQEIGLAVPF